MNRTAHCFFWGYGPSGFDILFRAGDWKFLETPCLDEVGRWKLAYDRESQVVTPVYTNGQPIAWLAFKSRVSTRSEGDKIRQTACAAIPFEHAAELSVHLHLLGQVPAFPEVGGLETLVPSGSSKESGAYSRPFRPLPVWSSRVWARLLDEQAVVLISERDATLDDALRTAALLPPAMASQVAVGVGLLPGVEPRCHGLFIQGAQQQASAGAEAVGDFESRDQLDGLMQAWFRREVQPQEQVDGGALRLWAECAADARCDLVQFGREQLLRAIASDVTYDWLRSGAHPSDAASLAPWMKAMVALNVNPDPVRLAGRLGATTTPHRTEIVMRIPQLANWLPAPDAKLATVMVGASVEAALDPKSLNECEDAFFDSHSWIGRVLCGPWPKKDTAVFTGVAWALVGELLAQWAEYEPDVLARALARPIAIESQGLGGWLHRFGRRSKSARTIEGVLQDVVGKQTPPHMMRLSRSLLPAALREVEGRCLLQPPSDVLERLFVRAALSAEQIGKAQPATVGAVAQLLALRAESSNSGSA